MGDIIQQCVKGMNGLIGWLRFLIKFFFSPPVPVVSATGRNLVFGISSSTHSVLFSESGPSNSGQVQYSNWIDLGGNATSPPTIIIDSEAFVHVFIRGTNRALWHLTETYTSPGPKQWGSWECLGGVLASYPKIPVGLNGVNLIEVYARAADKSLWHRAQTAQQNSNSVSWGSWLSLGGALASGPSISISDDGMTSIFARSTDKSLYFKSQYEDANGETQFTPWVTLGGSFSTTPTVVTRSNGLVDVFSRGVDNKIWYSQQTEVNGTKTFSSWQTIGGKTRKFTC